MSAPRSLYVSRRLLNGPEVLDWLGAVGISTAVKAADLHVTICYSHAKVDWEDAPDAPDNLTVPAGIGRTIEILGKGALVLRFQSPELAARHHQLLAIGTSHDFPDYLSHVTLSYDPQGFDVTTLSAFNGALTFGPEEFAEIVDDYVGPVTEKSSQNLPLIPRGLSGSRDSSESVVTTGLSDALHATKVPQMSTKALNVLAKLFKSLPDGALKDLEQIEDYTDDKNKVPSAGEIGAATETIGMHGAVAIPLVEKNGDMAPQHGITKLYQDLAGRLGRMEKSVGVVSASVKSLVEGIRKASEDDEDEDKENPFEKAEKSVRKSRIALRKAEDEEDEDAEDAVEKAERLVGAAKVAIEKAEDCDMSDDDENRMEKARKTLRTIKAGIEGVRGKLVAKKAAVKTEAAPAAIDPAAKADEPSVADLAKSQASLTEQLGVMTKSLAEVMGIVQGNGKVVVPMTPAPSPVLAKAATSELIETIAQAIDDADDNQQLGTGPLMKAKSLLLRFKSVQEGTLERSKFDAELAKADQSVQSIFAKAA